MAIFEQAQTMVQTAANKVQGAASGVFTKLQDSLQGALDVVDSVIQGNNLSGFNIAGLDSLKGKIDNHITEMQRILNDFAANVDPEIAYKGGYTGDIKTYLEEAKNICYNIISYMGYYKDRIEIIKQNIETRTGTMSSEIKANATQMSEENVQAYEAKY